LQAEADRVNVDSMRAFGFLVIVAISGCNALTGVDDLEMVDCVDCIDSVDSSVVDSSAPETAAPDVTPRDSTADVRPDADASEAEASVSCVLDSDCNDNSLCTRDRCTLAGNECVFEVIDGDGDGEASTSIGACGTDCHDGNASVFSSQMTFFQTAYTTTEGLKSFDYDCNSVEEKELTAVFVRCEAGCTTTPGWQNAAPACGVTGKWVAACRLILSSCVPLVADRIQRCR
jgi:hypothetical protein